VTGGAAGGGPDEHPGGGDSAADRDGSGEGGVGPPVSEGARRRLDAVFGDVLPEVTRDETGDPQDGAGGTGDEWLRANRPPHHDR
jgi:hypothetical protein